MVVDGGWWNVDGGRWSVESGRRTVDGGRRAGAGVGGGMPVYAGSTVYRGPVLPLAAGMVTSFLASQLCFGSGANSSALSPSLRLLPLSFHSDPENPYQLPHDCYDDSSVR